MQRTTCRAVTCLALSMAVLLGSGCAAVKLPVFKTGASSPADDEHPVAQIVCIWQPAEGRGLDELPSRGFAGQIVFLTNHSPTPIEVEGNVTIYLFDDQGSPEKQKEPLHVARFVGGSWQTHLKTTAWGPTYQLFLPYVRKGAHRASCSLAVQIDTPDGRRVTSEMANIVLAGSRSSNDPTDLPFAPLISRAPAGRVHQAVARGTADTSQVVPASAQSVTGGPGKSSAPHQTVPHQEASRKAGQFQSFSIPYDYHRAQAQ